MPTDIDLALSTLDLSEGLLRHALQHQQQQYRVQTEILAFAIAVEENAVLFEALQELERVVGSIEFAAVARYREDLIRRASQLFYETAEAIALLDPATQLLLEEIEVPRIKMGLSSFLQRFRWRSEIPSMDAGEIAAFATVTLQAMEQRLGPNLTDEIRGWKAKFVVLANEISGRFLVMERIAELRSVERTSARLRQLVQLWRDLERRGANLSTPGPLELSPDVVDVLALISRLRNQVLSHRPVAHALRRMKVYLEHFAYDDVRSRLAMAEKAHKAAQREAVLQQLIDRFLFEQGLFPLTHFETSRGRLDTLLPAAAMTREPPVLIELKQVVDLANEGSIVPAAVEKAIRDARPELARYLGGVRANLEWAHVTPLIVVVHTCQKALLLDPTPDVLLIDVSSKTPSKLAG